MASYSTESVALESPGPGGSLQWVEHMSGHWTAKGLGGKYDIYPRGAGGYTAYWSQSGTGSTHELGSYDTIGSAFAACRRHADGERRQTTAAEASGELGKDVARKSVASAYGSGEIDKVSGSGNHFTVTLKSGKRLHVAVDGSTGTVTDPDDGHVVATHTVSEAGECDVCAHKHPKSVPTTPCRELSKVAKEGHEKPIVIEKTGEHSWIVFVQHNPIVNVAKRGTKPELSWKGRKNYVEGSKRHIFKTRGDAENIAHQVGRYILNLGDFVFSYVEYKNDVPTATETVPVIHENGVVHKSNFTEVDVAVYRVDGVERVFAVADDLWGGKNGDSMVPSMRSPHYDMDYYTANAPKGLVDQVSRGEMDGRTSYVALSPYFVAHIGHVKRKKSKGGSHGHTLHEANDVGSFATMDRDTAEFAKGKALGSARTPQAIYKMVREPLSKESQEVFLVIPLDLHGEALSRPVEVARGQRDRVSVGISDVMRPVAQFNAKGFVVVHNHPSGHARPSPKDRELTETIRKYTFSDVKFCDHIVVGMNEFYSFEEKKLFKVS